MEASNVQYILDGQTVTASPDETVLNAAKRHGIDIPTLCHHESVTPYGACRLCLVEVSWGKRSKLVTSCIYAAGNGEVVQTNSERVRRARRLVLELLLTRCPDVELLQQLGREYGVEASRFHSHAVAADERCILCGLCVRVCDEVIGAKAIGFAQRGSERVISTPFGKDAEECIGCASCVFVCPTQALHYDDFDGKRIMKEWHTEVPLVACRVCGVNFATERQVVKMVERLAFAPEFAEVCPHCRGTEFRGTMEQYLVAKGSSR